MSLLHIDASLLDHRDVDVVVIGGGAAGLMTAATAGQRGRSVLVLEHTDAVGAKILISGGGRCNFTNLDVSIANFDSVNPDFARSALARYTPTDFIALVERHKIAYAEKTLGQLFCVGKGQARAIVDMLLAECARGDVAISCATTLRDLATTESGWRVVTSRGEVTCRALVVASGGLSIPKIGATRLAYDIAKRFDVAIEPPRPALVPLTFAAAEQTRFAELAGVSFDVVARASRGPAFREAMLFTHRGLSGPAVLQISTFHRRGETIEIDLTCGGALSNGLLDLKRTRPNITLATALAMFVPRRFAEHLSEGLDTRPLTAWRDADILARAQDWARWRVQPGGDEGYAKAEVTAGGVSTAALSSKTMAVKALPRLYFVGESVDMTGWLGGYNFQWAWSSGWAAGQAV